MNIISLILSYIITQYDIFLSFLSDFSFWKVHKATTSFGLESFCNISVHIPGEGTQAWETWSRQAVLASRNQFCQKTFSNLSAIKKGSLLGQLHCSLSVLVIERRTTVYLGVCLPPVACQCQQDPEEGHLSSPEMLHVAGGNTGISAIAKKHRVNFCVLWIPYDSFK